MNVKPTKNAFADAGAAPYGRREDDDPLLVQTRDIRNAVGNLSGAAMTAQADAMALLDAMPADSPLRAQCMALFNNLAAMSDGAREVSAMTHHLQEGVESRVADDDLMVGLFDKAEKDATTDSLTGVMNRRAFDAAIESKMREAQKSGTHLSMIIIDGDHFKSVNDTYGHLSGDAVLQQMASALQKGVRQGDLVARIGGEEFAVVLTRSKKSAAFGVAERLRKSIAKRPAYNIDGMHVPAITVSAGLAHMTKSDSYKDLYDKADTALYQAKQQGRDRVVVSTPRTSAPENKIA